MDSNRSRPRVKRKPFLYNANYFTIERIAREYGVTRKTVYEWIEYYKDSAKPFPQPSAIIRQRRYFQVDTVRAWCKSALKDLPAIDIDHLPGVYVGQYKDDDESADSA